MPRPGGPWPRSCRRTRAGAALGRLHPALPDRHLDHGHRAASQSPRAVLGAATGSHGRSGLPGSQGVRGRDTAGKPRGRAAAFHSGSPIFGHVTDLLGRQALCQKAFQQHVRNFGSAQLSPSGGAALDQVRMGFWHPTDSDGRARRKTAEARAAFRLRRRGNRWHGQRQGGRSRRRLRTWGKRCSRRRGRAAPP